MKTLFSLAALFTAVLAGSADAVNYVDHIMPVFKKKCFECHSLESGQHKGDLEFDHLEDLEKYYIGKYTSMRPFDPDESVLLDYVSDPSSDDTMPPPGKSERLTAEEIELVRKWLAEGAVMRKEDEEKAAAKQKELKLAKLKELDWTNVQGKVIKAKLLALDATHVTFLMADGRELKYPLDQLTPESQALAKEQAGAGG